MSKTRKCSLPDCHAWAWAKGLCSTHYKKKYARERGWSRGNRANTRRYLRKRTQWRRAKVYDSDADQIDRDEIGERDDWLCGICGDSVDNALSYPEPMSPSLDHIKPLSRGGKHTETNVQIAHLRCNIAKSDRVEADRSGAMPGHNSATEGDGDARTSTETSGANTAA